tara:strand:+ start:7301 stop:7777 length:477 start_codon:yes stop_codon:yes gene_type:complete
MYLDEVKQKKAIQDKIIVANELINYMEKLKEICDEAMIGYSIQQGLIDAIQSAIVEENDAGVVVDTSLYESSVQEICYSPISDTFSIFVNNPSHAQKLMDKLEILFDEKKMANNRIYFEIQNDYGIIEIIYSKDKYYTKHIQNNIKDIICLNAKKSEC